MAMPELQRLLMQAYQDPEAMEEIRRLLEGRVAEKRAASVDGMTAPMSYGQMSLEDMIARASGQQTDKSFFGGIKRAMDVDPMKVGGSIWGF